MDTAKSIFLAISIILLTIGAWPIAILTVTVSITLAIVAGIQRKKELQELKTEIQRLRQELAEQAVQRAMDKAEQRKTILKEETET